MGHAALNILGIEAPIKPYGGIEFVYQGVRFPAKTPAPNLPSHRIIPFFDFLLTIFD
jgi:hypothetical protein